MANPVAIVKTTDDLYDHHRVRLQQNLECNVAVSGIGDFVEEGIGKES